MNPIILRVFSLIGTALTLLAAGEPEQARSMLRKAANQLDEVV
jgi:hypothetical protein